MPSPTKLSVLGTASGRGVGGVEGLHGGMAGCREQGLRNASGHRDMMSWGQSPSMGVSLEEALGIR